MMALQARLKKLDAEADEMIKAQHTGQKEPEQVAEPEVAADVAVEVVEQPTVAVAEQPAGEPQPVAPVDESAQLRAELARSEQRYRSLQGMFDKSRDELDALRQMVKQLSEAQPKPEPAKPAKFVTEKDEEAYGSDMIDLIRRAAQEIVESKFGSLDGRFAEVDQRVKQVGEVVHRTAAERFNDDLTDKVPDWEEVNVDPAFTEWLGPYGLQGLRAAYQALDVNGTAKFFNDYKKLTAPAEVPATEPAAKKLETMQAPGKARTTASTSQQPKGKIWTAADINKLYDRKSKLSPAEFRALEDDLFKAQSEGRIAR